MIKAIFEDTRQQMGKHENIAQYLKSRGIELIRQALFVGDYVKITDHLCVKLQGQENTE